MSLSPGIWMELLQVEYNSARAMPVLHDAFITGIGSFSPGDPLSFEDAERVLGPLDEAPAKLRAWIHPGMERRTGALAPLTGWSGP